MKIRRLMSLFAIASAAVSAHAGQVVPVFSYPDPALFAVQYGDFYSFSMPILSSYARGYSKSSVSQFGNGDPYYINTANVIGGALVVGTGAGGNQNNQDLGLTSYVQDGYDFPNLTGNDTGSFSTDTATDPGPADATYNKAGTWDIQLSALREYLTVSGTQYDLVAYFNNNQQKRTVEANNLWAYAEVILTDVDGNGGTKTLKFTNPASGHTDSDGNNYVLSGGPVTLCFNWADPTKTGNNDARVEVPCSGAHAMESTYEHNLGQNDVAYGLISDELNQVLLDTGSVYDLMSIRVRFDALNNGYENLYLAAACINRDCGGDNNVPEPGTLSLLAAGLFGLSAGWVTRRKSHSS